MNPQSLLVCFFAGIAALGMTAALFIPIGEPPAHESTAPLIRDADIPEFGRKPCPTCGAPTFPVNDEGLRLCHTCGDGFTSKD